LKIAWLPGDIHQPICGQVSGNATAFLLVPELDVLAENEPLAEPATYEAATTLAVASSSREAVGELHPSVRFHEHTIAHNHFTAPRGAARISEDLTITRGASHSAGEHWIRGTLNGYRFGALVFDDHALYSD
jgi:hypothetical protein